LAAPATLGSIIDFLPFTKFSKMYLPLALVTLFRSMIVSFGSKETEKIWLGQRVPKIPLTVQEAGRRKLRMIHNAIDLADLRIPPANRLEKLSGDLKNFYSVRINDQWRVIFKWNAGNVSEVEIFGLPLKPARNGKT
jgi:proteic killer suppression protein